jgi:hypothetical protein
VIVEEWEQAPHPGGAYGKHRILGGWKIVLHDTDGISRLDAAIDSINTDHPKAPYHAVGDPVLKRVAQQASLEDFVGGMKNPERSTVDTNGCRAIQLCVCGKAKDAASRDTETLRWIGEALLAPVLRRFPVARNVVDLNMFGGAGSFVAAATASPARKFWDPPKGFEQWSGITMHGCAPLNDHWDDGWVNLNRIVDFAWAAAHPDPPSVQSSAFPVMVGGTARGYFMADSRGVVKTFGDAVHRGDCTGIPINAPIVAGEVNAAGDGYWLLGADGGVFNFGAAGFFGSVPGVLTVPMHAPATAINRTRSERGYWITAADGGVFAFGDAHFAGSGATA